MNTEQVSLTPVLERSAPQTAVADELTRVKIFLGIQAFFLVVSVFTGGFNFKLWSMLDTALMIQSIGITAWVVVHPRSAEYKRVLKKQIPPISSCMKAALTLVVLVVTLGMGFAQGTVVLENQTNGLVKQWTSFSDQTLISVPESGGYVQLIAAHRLSFGGAPRRANAFWCQPELHLSGRFPGCEPGLGSGHRS